MKIAASTFLVTGGSSGLGAACVQMLSEEGANVVIADLNATENILRRGFGSIRSHKTTDEAAYECG